MKLVALALALASVAAATATPTFESWSQANGRKFTDEESVHRRAIYEANAKMIDEHNSGDKSWTMAANGFADMTTEEFRARFLTGMAAPESQALRGSDAAGKRSATPPKEYTSMLNGNTPIPASVDWTTKGAVTGIKNQAQCGSCWAFSATGGMEGAYFLAGNKLTSFSEQQLVACSDKYGNMGCGGGLPQWGFKYTIHNGGLATEETYPYTAGNGDSGKCEASKKAQVKDVIDNFWWPEHGSSTSTQAAIVQAPVSIGVVAGPWQFYSGGILAGSCQGQIDHGVLAVGFDSDKGTMSDKAYWKVKNSWGQSWGMNGYIHLSMSVDASSTGQCCINCQGVVPVSGAGTALRQDDSVSGDDEPAGDDST